ncbi:MAG: hypothetical protein DMF69_22270 [Acidobacteria bacterium]|nr:MAG: hypothetical protein DMF69_22270 [Acidobacteriota bacterium]
MRIFTLDRGFIEKDEIDLFESALWTERYRGDGDFELSVEANEALMNKLPRGQLLMCDGSAEPMILETRDIKDDILKTTGITLTQWLNNRTIRTTADHKIKEWLLTGYPVGEAMMQIVQQMCIGGPYLSGGTPIGIPSGETTLWSVPGLVAGAFDTAGGVKDLSVPFGPVFDALKTIAETYDVGQKITLDFAFEDEYQITYISYRGADRTSAQTINPTVRFSKEMDSFSNIHDLESLADHRNSVYLFAPNAAPAIVTNAGHAVTAGPTPTGFDLKVEQAFLDDLPTGLDATSLMTLLNQKALTELQNRKVVQLVDGEITQVLGVQYGVNFFMGDIVEVEGNTGIRQNARVTEYIRSQDSAGERSYPTLSMIE